MQSMLYKFFDIDLENPRHKAKFRPNAVYLRGVRHLSTEKIFDYFGGYSPSYLEWIDDASCNVVWNDRTAAARGLLGMSKPLRHIRPTRIREEDEPDKEEFESPMKRIASDPEKPGALRSNKNRLRTKLRRIPLRKSWTTMNRLRWT